MHAAPTHAEDEASAMPRRHFETDGEYIRRLCDTLRERDGTIAQMKMDHEAIVASLRTAFGDAQRNVTYLENRVAELEGENARVKAQVVSEMQTLQARLEDAESRIQSKAPTDGSSVQGICIRWHEQGHKTALESVFQAAARESNLPGDMCYEWSPGAKYALVIVPLFPATVKLDASVLDAIRDARAAASSVVLVAMRWGVNAPELLLGQVRDCGAEVVNLYWEKDHAERKSLARCQKNEQNIAALRGIIQSAVPVRRVSASSTIGGLFSRLGWR